MNVLFPLHTHYPSCVPHCIRAQLFVKVAHFLASVPAFPRRHPPFHTIRRPRATTAVSARRLWLI
ncbi:hypothetical protein C8R42DRAFT_660392 [Lentinula raphanica]|nr:hypothetical protein C8R42DRAFT_660392 [Lentinula raphanica]